MAKMFRSNTVMAVLTAVVSVLVSFLGSWLLSSGRYSQFLQCEKRSGVSVSSWGSVWWIAGCGGGLNKMVWPRTGSANVVFPF